MTDTTFSEPESFFILTPWVFLPAVLISFTAHLMMLPLSVDNIISSDSFTTNDDAIFPFLGEFIIPIIPLPPLFVTR